MRRLERMTEPACAPRGTDRRNRRIRRAGALRIAAAALVATSLVALAAPPVAAEDEHFMEFVTPAMAVGQALPAFDSPPLRPVTLATPAIRAPGTCMLSPCDEPTVLPGAGVFTPSLGPQPIDAPPLATERSCDPAAFACVDGFAVPGQHLGDSPDLEAQGLELPGNELPPFCQDQSMVCLGPYEVPAQTLLSTPDTEARTLTPEAGASLGVPSLVVWMPQYEPETGTVEPTPLEVPLPLLGPLGIVVCERGCPQPLVPDLPLASSGDAGATLWVDEHRVGLDLAPLLDPDTS